MKHTHQTAPTNDGTGLSMGSSMDSGWIPVLIEGRTPLLVPLGHLLFYTLELHSSSSWSSILLRFSPPLFLHLRGVNRLTEPIRST